MPESNPHPFMASATNLTNAEISAHINQMAPKLMRLFKDKSALATSESAAAPQALFTTIQALVNNPQAADDTPLSLEQLNYNYDLLSTGNCIKRHFLISPPANCTEQDKASLALTAVIHLNAIVDGFKLSADTENTNSSPQRRSATPQIREVHHYHGCRSNFWRDMMFYQMIFGNNNQGSNYPSQTSSTGNNSQEDKNKLIDDLRGLFLSYKIDGANIVDNVYEGTEIYEGPYAHRAPDLILMAAENIGLSGRMNPNEKIESTLINGKHTYEQATFFLRSDSSEHVPKEVRVEDCLSLVNSEITSLS